jgi:uncharacterized protein YyaL (SSP411 family)
VKRVLVLLSILALATSAGAATHIGNAKTPYLALHATDAVDWYAWGDEAFARAKRESKPVFLSVGYASCHWCHVLQRESFAQGELAMFINANFVPVLVDREELPDVDATYVAFLQVMTNGHAGWPANFVLSPDLAPLAGATYMKPDALRSALASVADRWKNDRAALLANGGALLADVRASALEQPPAQEVRILDAQRALTARLRAAYDKANGGFGTAPKFPQPMAIAFLLRSSDGEDRRIALDSLRAIARGAVHDQVGGGFHRYAADAEWRLAHFEKTLADQALMAIVYTEAWQISKDASFQRVARDTLDYATRELQLQNGAFASAADADSLAPDRGPRAFEGIFYTWTADELQRLLPKAQYDAVVSCYGIAEGGNVPREVDPSGDFRGRNVLAARTTTCDQKLLDAALPRMQLVRSHRPAPRRDEKVIAGWNALMISALARAGMAFDEPHYVYAAQRAARFLETALWNAKTQKLWHRWAAGEVGVDAYADDYAAAVQAELDLFEASHDVRCLTRAIAWQQVQDDRFWNGATLRYDSGESNVPASIRQLTLERDAAAPSANAISALNLLRIAAITGSAPARAKADAIFRSFAPRMSASPAELPALITALSASAAPPREIVILGSPIADDTKALLRAANERFAPIRVLFFAGVDPSRSGLLTYAPLLKEMKIIDQRATAYVCMNNACKPPVTDPGKLAALLEEGLGVGSWELGVRAPLEPATAAPQTPNPQLRTPNPRIPYRLPSP